MAKSQFRPAVSAFLLMVTMSLLSTALSFFVVPVCSDLGFGRGSFTLYYSLMVAAGAVSASFLGTYMNQHGVRGVILVSGIWCGLGFLGLSVSSHLWMFYLLGAAMGLFGSTCVYLAANVIVQQSYSSKNASAILGIVMAGAGIGGVACSNILPQFLENFGWRMGYRMLGFCWLGLALLAALILGKQETAVAFGHTKSGALGGTSKKDALKSGRFYMATGLMCILAVCSCISQHLPSVLGEMGHNTTQIGMMVSVMTAGSAVGTMAEGLVFSKLGIKKNHDRCHPSLRCGLHFHGPEPQYLHGPGISGLRFRFHRYIDAHCGPADLRRPGLRCHLVCGYFLQLHCLLRRISHLGHGLRLHRQLSACADCHALPADGGYGLSPGCLPGY